MVSCNLEVLFFVCYCCVVESMIEVKSELGLKIKNGVMFVERRVISRFRN